MAHGAAWPGRRPHAFFLGFVFSRVFAFAPARIQELTDIPLTYSPRFYVHVALLHASLLLRVMADFLGSPTGRTAGSMLT